MEIPKKCEGCDEADEIINRPVQGFIARLEDITGRRIGSWGNLASRSHSGYPPEFVNYVEGGSVDRDLVRDAWYDAIHDRQNIDNELQELVKRCPGLCEATIEFPRNRKDTVLICGKKAVELSKKKNKPKN